MKLKTLISAFIFLVSISLINSCSKVSPIVVGGTYFLYNDTSPELQCSECDNWWYIKITGEDTAELFSAKSETSFPSCRSNVKYFCDPKSTTFRILTIPNNNISDECKSKFYGKWIWEQERLTKVREKAVVIKKTIVKKNDPVLTQNILNALNKLKEKWKYQIEPFGDYKSINDSGLTENENEDRDVNFIVLKNCLIASYRTKNAIDYGTQIITFEDYKNILEFSTESFFVENIDNSFKKLIISKEGYDKNGHWWQKGTFDLESKNTVFNTDKVY